MPVTMRRIDPVKSLFEFTVRGRGQFPFDMLRYDQCWPKAEAPDVPALTRTAEERSLTLLGTHSPTVERWRSFGWRVT